MGYSRDKSPYCLRFALAGLALSSLFTVPSIAEVVSIDVASRDTLTTADADFSYESIRGVVHFTLDPNAAANAAVVDLALRGWLSIRRILNSLFPLPTLPPTFSTTM